MHVYHYFYAPTRRLVCQLAVLTLMFLTVAIGRPALACPFCAVESQTLSEEIAGADVAVLAKLVKEAAPADSSPAEPGGEGTATGNATFEIVEILRGEDKLQEKRQIEVVFFGEPNRDQLFLIPGIRTDQLSGTAPPVDQTAPAPPAASSTGAIDWTTPLPLSAAAVDYVRALPALAPSGVDRLAFFQNYFEHEDPLLAQDAYDEFARAPYADVNALGPQMHHDKLIQWIQSPEISPSRRRLYFTMLGACGKPTDLPLLEEMITSDYASKQPFVESLVYSGLAVGGPVALPAWIEMINQDERRKKLGLDALVACYLVLRGPDGLDLIDEEILKNRDAEYTHIYSTIMALRFHGDEVDIVPRERLLASMRLLLDNPDFADQVIIDLSRWDDWSVLDRLVGMFKAADEKGYVRQPIVTYLTVASEQPGDVGQRATTALAELEKFDPESVKRAKSLMAFGFLGRARAGSDSANAAQPEAASGAATAAVASAPKADVTAFAASAADAAEAQASAADIPDPATFQSEEAAPAVAATEAPSESAAEPATETDAAAPVATTPAPVASGASPKQSIPETPSDDLEVLQQPSKALIVGLPLAGAGALMALYWWILRSGAA